MRHADPCHICTGTGLTSNQPLWVVSRLARLGSVLVVCFKFAALRRTDERRFGCRRRCPAKGCITPASDALDAHGAQAELSVVCHGTHVRYKARACRFELVQMLRRGAFESMRY